MIPTLYENYRHWSDDRSVYILSDLHFDDAMPEGWWFLPLHHIRSVQQWTVLRYRPDQGRLLFFSFLFSPDRQLLKQSRFPRASCPGDKYRSFITSAFDHCQIEKLQYSITPKKTSGLPPKIGVNGFENIEQYPPNCYLLYDSNYVVYKIICKLCLICQLCFICYQNQNL